jgi:hypothetical protein
MITVKADARGRLRLPGVKPGQVFAFENQGNGVRVLTEVKKDVKQAFPRGSLKYLCNPVRNKELERLAAATIQGVPKDHEK